MRVEAIRGAVAVVAMLSAGCGSPQPQPKTEPLRTEQESRSSRPPMAAFVRALQQQDRETFLSFFPTSGPWHYTSTITQPPSVTAIGPAAMKADFEQRKGMYEALFDADGDDCFRDWVMNSDVSAWVESHPGRFVRQKTSGRDSVYVEWQREGDRWVVRTIAEPSA